MTRLLPVLADAALVLLFACLGRRSHEHGLSLTGLFQTAGPFLCGTAAGWLLAAGLTSDGYLRIRRDGSRVTCAATGVIPAA